MMDWCIRVKKSSTKRQKGYVVHVEEPFVVAKWASKANPDCEVHVSAHARLRAIYKNGKVVSQHKKLSEFYPNVSARTDWEWKYGMTFTEEEEIWSIRAARSKRNEMPLREREILIDECRQMQARFNAFNRLGWLQ